MAQATWRQKASGRPRKASCPNASKATLVAEASAPKCSRVSGRASNESCGGGVNLVRAHEQHAVRRPSPPQP
eukprot:13245378-Alexandrium_andersonii.AAC.1